VAAESWSSRPERFDALRKVTLWPSGREMAVEQVWWHKNAPVFVFTGIDSINAAEPLAGELACVPVAERIVLEPGEVFYGDLIGCEVFDRPSGRSLGRVTDYTDTGAQVLLEVGKHSIPFVPALCVLVDIPGRRIETELPGGFLELNA